MRTVNIYIIIKYQGPLKCNVSVRVYECYTFMVRVMNTVLPSMIYVIVKVSKEAEKYN